jgi:hypothetical protein
MQGGIMLPSDSEKDDGDYILVCGFGRVGQAVCDLLTTKLVRYKAFDMDPYRVAEARELGLPVFYADARRRDLTTTYHIPPTTYHLPHTTYHIPPTIYHLPYTTYHIPHTSHLLPPTSYLLIFITPTRARPGVLHPNPTSNPTPNPNQARRAAP